MIEADVNKLKEALKKIGRITEGGKFMYKDMDVVRDFCAEALGSYDFSEAKPISSSERRLDLLANGNPKVKSYLLAQATELIHNVEVNGKVAGYVTYMAGNLGAIHAGLREMEWDAEGKEKDQQHFDMKEALFRIVETTNRQMDRDEKYSAIAGVARTVMEKSFGLSFQRKSNET